MADTESEVSEESEFSGLEEEEDTSEEDGSFGGSEVCEIVFTPQPFMAVRVLFSSKLGGRMGGQQLPLCPG